MCPFGLRGGPSGPRAPFLVRLFALRVAGGDTPAPLPSMPPVPPSKVLATGTPEAEPLIAVRAAAPPTGKRLLLLSFAALGVVYGDIGTSPLYAIRECFRGPHAAGTSPREVLGILSLVFWALVLVVTVKYQTLILRADNNGEGGVLALTALLGRATRRRGGTLLLMLGIFGAALLYGDGMITPAISVLSAMEGLELLAPSLHAFVVPCTIVVLALLFLVQNRGTIRVGAMFAPVMILWFLVIATLGLVQVVAHPSVLAAVNPVYGVRFIVEHGKHGFLVLGTVFLAVTGTEALYADMGHFGRRPIRVAWSTLVLPALCLNYFGQGALLLTHPEEVAQPFFALAPSWFLGPLVVLATVATSIASQAVISGTFSLTRQAIQLGYAPRMRVVHTSPHEIGQIFIPEINRILMVGTIGLVLFFKSSGNLVAAYGVAVTTTMIVTTVLFCFVSRVQWGWSRTTALLVAIPFLVIDAAFFGANITKIAHGAWFPLAVGALVYVLMSTWRRGRSLLADKLRLTLPRIEDFIRTIEAGKVQRVNGKAVFLTGNPDVAPPAILHNLKHNQVVHAEVAFLTIVTEDIPRVPRERRVTIEHLGNGFYKVYAYYGFMENPDVPEILTLAREQGMDFPLSELSFFLSRQRFLPSKNPGMRPWRQRIFALLSRNTLGATTYFHIPPRQVVELGTQVQI